MTTETLAVYLTVAAICGAFALSLADRKGEERWVAFLLGFFFSVLGVLYMLSRPTIERITKVYTAPDEATAHQMVAADEQQARWQGWQITDGEWTGSAARITFERRR